MPRRRGGNGGDAPASLKLSDYSDRELMIIVDEVADENGGWGSSLDIAKALGMTAETRTNSVGSRLAALRRFGAVDKRHDVSPSEWSLTPIGKTLAFGQPSQARLNLVDSSTPADLLLLTRTLAVRGHTQPEVTRKLVRREWVRSSGLAR